MKVGVLSFSDGRKRVHDGLVPAIRKHEAQICDVLKSMGAEPIGDGDVIFQPRMAVCEAKRLLAQDVGAVVFNIPVFAFPNLSVIAADVLQKPVAIVSPGDPRLPGMGGMLAAGGALEQTGHFHTRIWGPLTQAGNAAQLAAYVRAATARHTLRGQVYGQIGGRSIGMLTGVATSAIEWHKVFGVDCDHVDESEIVRRAAQLPAKECARIVRWLEEHCGTIHYHVNAKLTRATLKQQGACAAAVKQIIRERQFDFIGLKCHYDMSEYYSPQCLSAAFLPSYSDWDGPREPLVCACEADGDGALTMQVLQLISRLPALFMDLRHYDTKKRMWTMCNCGGMSPYYARRANTPGENLRHVELVPVIQKYGGTGCHVRYIGCAGALTCARIMHDAHGIALLLFKAEAVPGRREWLKDSCPNWPHLFVRTAVNHTDILKHLHANHVHAVAGDWMDAMEMFANMACIRVVKLVGT